MKALKITLVATLASTLAWWLGFPQRIWPAHPYLANSLIALALYLLLQFAWPNSNPAQKTERH